MRTLLALLVSTLMVLTACSKKDSAAENNTKNSNETQATQGTTPNPEKTDPKKDPKKDPKTDPEVKKTVTTKTAIPTKIPKDKIRPAGSAGDIPAPADVAAPPADAQKTASGLASKILTPGTGSKKPAAVDKVKVHYTGWTTDGKMFDSSVKRGRPAEFGLNRVIKGWTEGLQLMVEGEKRRFWIPEELAYKGSPGRPQGMLVFDVELISITELPKPPEAPKDLANPPANAETLGEGIKSRVLTPGKEKLSPKNKDVVTFHFTAWASDGNVIDSTITRGRSIEIPLDRLPTELKTSLAAMTGGEKRRVWVSEALASKSLGRGRKGAVVVDLELLKVGEGPKAIPAPEIVAAAPKDAEKTASGLASKVLKKGTGTEHPKATSKVTVHYTGWTTDGTMFDSSVARKSPATFPLSGVIKGWTEGVQLMVVGEKRRFWIPEDLAYKGRPGAPQGMLVFDVELLSIGAGK